MDALQRNALARQQLAEVVEQHNQRTAGLAHRPNSFQPQRPQQPNHFEQRPAARSFGERPTAPERIQQRPIAPAFEQPPSSSAFEQPLSSSALQPAAPADLANHNEALQRNALHRKQLAEVVAKHNDRTVQVAKENGISHETENEIKSENDRQQSASEDVPRVRKVDDFLAKKTVSTKSSSAPPAKSPLSSKDEANSKYSDLPKELADHLVLLSELDRQVEDLFSQARVVFSSSEKPSRRKGGKRRPAQADPRRTELDKDLEYLE